MGHGDRSSSAIRRSRSPAGSTPGTGTSTALVPVEAEVQFTAGAKGKGKPPAATDPSTADVVAEIVQKNISAITTNLVVSMQPAVAELVTKVQSESSRELMGRLGQVETSVSGL